MTKTKFIVTKKEFLKPLKNKVIMNNMVAKNLKRQGKSNEEINDHLQMIDDN